MNKRLLYWSGTSSLAGFLFGFDTVVISGAEQRIQVLWGLGAGLHGAAMAAALYGTVLGAMLGGWPTDRFGRRATLKWIGILYLVSAVWSAVSPDVVSFIIARWIGGLGVGISTVASPLYIAEISPPAYRGRLTGLFQFNIVFGILVAFMSNALLANLGEHSWRWMLGVEAVPALIYTILCFGLPESPRWLVTRKGDRAAALAVLRLTKPEAPEADLSAEVDAMAGTAEQRKAPSRFWSGRLRKPIFSRCLLLSSISSRASMPCSISRRASLNSPGSASRRRSSSQSVSESPTSLSPSWGCG